MNQLAQTQNKQDFINSLNQATGFQSSLPYPKMLSFDAKTGMWSMETDDKDADGKSVYKEVGESLKLHIITTRKTVQSNFKNKELGYYSKEFLDDYFELLQKVDGEVRTIYKGQYSVLKNSQNPTAQLLFSKIQYNVILYVFAGANEQKLYRVKLNGSKLGKLFPYLNSFVNESPAMYETTASKGSSASNGGVDYFELNFLEGKEIDQETIIKRVNAVNEYLQAYDQAKKQPQTVSPQNNQLPPAPQEYPQDVFEEAKPMTDAEVANIPF